MLRAMTILMEELEETDWYNQRVDACKDRGLSAILDHNRAEENSMQQCCLNASEEKTLHLIKN